MTHEKVFLSQKLHFSKWLAEFCVRVSCTSSTTGAMAARFNQALTSRCVFGLRLIKSCLCRFYCLFEIRRIRRRRRGGGKKIWDNSTQECNSACEYNAKMLICRSFFCHLAVMRTQLKAQLEWNSFCSRGKQATGLILPTFPKLWSPDRKAEKNRRKKNTFWEL